MKTLPVTPSHSLSKAFAPRTAEKSHGLSMHIHAADYRFPPLPSGVTYDPRLDGIARQWFQRLRVPQEMAHFVVASWNAAMRSRPSPAEIAQRAIALRRKLEKAWGQEYQRRICRARDLLRSVGGEELLELLDISGLITDERILCHLCALAEEQNDKSQEEENRASFVQNAHPNSYDIRRSYDHSSS